MWISLVISYACAKFHDDVIINNGIILYFSCFLFCVFWTNDKGLSIMTSLSMTILIPCKSFFTFDGLLLCKISL